MTGLTAAAGRRARAARSLLLATTALVAIELMAGEAAWADCAPAAANNVTAECTGTTTNQGGGAPGTSAAVFGYGTGVQTGVTVNVANGAGNTVTGDSFGIYLGDATVTNGTAASITGGQIGIYTATGSANVINSGGIAGGALHGIFALSDATVTNNTAGSITGGQDGVRTQLGIANVINSGSITGDDSGIRSVGGSVIVVNSGSITGTSLYGVSASTDATVTNNTGGGITGDDDGIQADVVNVTNSGSITGTSGYGIRAFNAGSSVFNAGTISGGTAAISFTGGGNTLTLAPGSVVNGNVLGAGANTFQLGGAGAATFDVSALGPAAQYQGFGTFNKIDSSIWTLTGNTTFTGSVNVNGGTLVVNGSLASAVPIFVNPGGTLAGTGTVPFTLLDNGATLAPGPLGSGTGALTINDRVMFCTCSTYAVKVSGTGNDFAQVMAGGLGPGDAFLAGAVLVTSPTSTYRFNSSYTILTTQGGLNGTTFDSLALAAPPGIAGTLSYTANDVLLTLISGLGQITGLNQNQRAVATALDTAFNAGAQTGGLGAIFNGNVAHNLTQASGEIATSAQQTTFDAMNLFLGLLTDPFVAGRSGGVTGGTGAMPFAEEGNGANAFAASKPRSRNEREAYAAVYRKAAPVPESFAQRWSVWAAGYGGSQTTDGNAAVGSNTATSRIAGSAVGADYRFSPFTLAGFALAGGGTNFSIANGLGSGRSDLFQAGAFIRHHAGPAYLSAALAYGWQDVTTDRTVTIAGIDRRRAKFNANAWSGRVEGGYRFVAPWMNGLGITPYAAGQFTTFELPDYAEGVVSGANTFALAYAAKSVTATRSELGVRTDKSFAVRDGVLILRGRFAWAHDFNTDRNVAATFQTLPGASFVVNGAAHAHDAALTTTSAEMRWLNGFSAAATFEGEFSTATRSYAGKGVVRYTW